MDVYFFLIKMFIIFLGLCFTSIYCETSVDIDNHVNWKNLPSDSCGVAKLSNRIFGGTKAAIGQYPWMALLQYLNYQQYLEFNCAGTLISRRYVVTAAHCDSFVNHTLKRVRLGENFLNQTEDCENEVCAPPVQDIEVQSMVIHPQFDAQAIINDIAIILLKQQAVFNDYVQPACIPRGSVIHKTFNMSEIAGWGQISTNGDLHSDELLFISVPIQSMEICKQYYLRKLIESQICAGEGKGRDSCAGDSGGPLMRSMSTGKGIPRYYLLGVTSYGKKECGEKPALYTRITSFLDWILNNVTEN